MYWFDRVLLGFQVVQVVNLTYRRIQSTFQRRKTARTLRQTRWRQPLTIRSPPKAKAVNNAGSAIYGAPPWRVSFTALEVPRIFRVAVTHVMRVLGVCAQWPAPPGESFPRCDHGIWSCALFHPSNRGGQQVEIVECEFAAPAVIHARH